MSRLIRREELFAPFEKHFNQLFDKLFGDDGLHSFRSLSRSGYPKIDVLVTDGRYIVEAAVPGVVADELKVEVLPFEESGVGSKQRMLKISGKMARDYQYSNSINYAVKELRRSHFERSMLLPDDIEGDPEAVLDNGILTLTWQLPKSLTPVEAKEITIKKV